MSPQRLPRRRSSKSSQSIKTHNPEAAKSSQTIDTVEFPVKKKKKSRPSRAERIDQRKKESNTNPLVVIAIVAVLGGGAYFISTQNQSPAPALLDQPGLTANQPAATPQPVALPTQEKSNTATNSLVPLNATNNTTKSANANNLTPLRPFSSTPIPSAQKQSRNLLGKAFGSKIKVNAPGAILVIKNLDEVDTQVKTTIPDSTTPDSTTPDSNSPVKKSDNLISQTIKGIFTFPKTGESKKAVTVNGYLFDNSETANIPKASSSTEIVRLDSDQLIHELPLKTGDHYEISAYLDGQATEVFAFQASPTMSASQPDGSRQLEIQFSPEQIKSFQLSATCALKSADSESFSGFLFGNRKTVATSVRALTTPNISEIQIIFNQGEATEKAITGARLIHFDAVEDVALLELPEELAEGTPYFISAGVPEKEQNFVVVGQKTDKEQSVINTLDLQKFSLNQSIKATSIGGPVAKAGNLEVMGIVTSHLHQSSITELDNRNNQAAIIKLADVPFQLWLEMDIEDQFAQHNKLNTLFERNFDLLRAARVAEKLSNDGDLYSEFCLNMLGEFMAFVNEATLEISEQAPQSFMIRAQKKAALDFKRKDGRKLATSLRKEMTPELQFEDQLKQYEELLTNTKVDSRIKEALTRSFDIYKEIKKSSVIILKTSSTKDQKTDDEYLDWMTNLRKDLEMNCNDVVALVNHAVMN